MSARNTDVRKIFHHHLVNCWQKLVELWRDVVGSSIKNLNHTTEKRAIVAITIVLANSLNYCSRLPLIRPETCSAFLQRLHSRWTLLSTLLTQRRLKQNRWSRWEAFMVIDENDNGIYDPLALINGKNQVLPSSSFPFRRNCYVRAVRPRGDLPLCIFYELSSFRAMQNNLVYPWLP